MTSVSCGRIKIEFQDIINWYSIGDILCLRWASDGDGLCRERIPRTRAAYLDRDCTEADGCAIDLPPVCRSYQCCSVSKSKTSFPNYCCRENAAWICRSNEYENEWIRWIFWLVENAEFLWSYSRNYIIKHFSHSKQFIYYLFYYELYAIKDRLICHKILSTCNLKEFLYYTAKYIAVLCSIFSH